MHVVYKSDKKLWKSHKTTNNNNNNRWESWTRENQLKHTQVYLSIRHPSQAPRDIDHICVCMIPIPSLLVVSFPTLLKEGERATFLWSPPTYVYMCLSIKVLLHPPPYVRTKVVVVVLYLMGPIGPKNNQINLIIIPCTCPTTITKKNKNKNKF
jgi:hypothetical protein